MSWSSTEINGKTADVFVPEGTADVKQVVVFLHGYDNLPLKGNQTYTDLLQRHGLACVCPHGPGCWWTDRVYSEFDAHQTPIDFLTKDIPAFCHSQWNVAPPRIAVFGVEMGGQGALQLAYRRARQFPVVAAVSPKVDFESWHGHGTTLDVIFPSREAARQATVTLHIHPLDWPKHQLLVCDPADVYCIDGVVTLASKLSSTGIPFESDLLTTAGGFGWSYANHMASRVIEFLAGRLAAE